MIRATFLAALCLFLAAAGAAHANSPEKDGNLVGKPSPAFDMTDLAGKKVSSAALFKAGKITIVNFWGLRCSACIQELPHLNALHEKFGDKVTILGCNVDAIDRDTLDAQIRKMKVDIRYTVIPDPDFRMVDAFRMTAAPLTVIVDGAGIVRLRHENYEPGDEKKIEDAVLALIAGKAVAGH